MRIERYDKYKESELDLLSEVPYEWGLNRIKYISHIQYSNVDKKSYEGQKEIFLCNYVDVYKNEYIDKSIKFMKSTASYEEIKKFTLRQDDVLFTKDSESFDDNVNPCLINDKLKNVICGYHLALVRPNKNKLIGKYLFRALQSVNYNYYFAVNSKGITRVGLGLNIAKDAKIYLPPLNIQFKIVNFLDTKTQKLDNEISLLEQKIKKYQELKQTLINESVLRGLNKDVELKNSEIAWLGNIPKHWNVKRLKDFIIYTIGGAVIDVSYWGEGNELTYTAGKNPVMSNFDEFPDRKRTKSNDILIARNGDGFIHIPKLNSIFTNVVQLVRLNKKVDVRFIRYSLENVKFHINQTSNGDFIASLNKEMWFNSFIMYPSFEEQVEIANYLDEKTINIDKVIKTIGTKIELLKEFRKTLINDVVIGKVKVA